MGGPPRLLLAGGAPHDACQSVSLAKSLKNMACARSGRRSEIRTSPLRSVRKSEHPQLTDAGSMPWRRIFSHMVVREMPRAGAASAIAAAAVPQGPFGSAAAPLRREPPPVSMSCYARRDLVRGALREEVAGHDPRARRERRPRARSGCAARARCRAMHARGVPPIGDARSARVSSTPASAANASKNRSASHSMSSGRSRSGGIDTASTLMR